MAGLYIHIPFCKKVCGYCDFYKSASLSKKEALLNALIKEMQHRRIFMDKHRLETIYLGGGTPTTCSPDELGHLLTVAEKLWGCDDVGEITVEANPDDLTTEYLQALRTATPINRLSIGIQSFIDRDLTFMNRRHTARQAIDAVQKAQNLGFDNISIDLIYGIPGMTIEEWENNIETALSLQVQHVSAYHLTFEPRTPFGIKAERGELQPVDETCSETEYLLLHRMLTEAEFEHYEISNFALAGYRSRHNSSYWNDTPYLGVGPAAHSYDGDTRWQTVASLSRYIAEAGTETIYTYERLNSEERYNEFVMVSLRTAEGIDLNRLESLFGARKLQFFLHSARRFIENGSLKTDGKKYWLPPERFLIADYIIGELFDIRS